MAVFTSVNEAELSAWLKNYSLGKLVEYEGIASGIENTNYFVTTTSGRFVLTLFEKLTDKELPFYLNLMSHLARHGIPCPSPVADSKDNFLGTLNGRPACIVSRLAGKSQMQPDVQHCAAIGAMLAQMHVAGTSFPDSLENPRGKRWRTMAAEKVRRFLKAKDVAILEAELELQQKDPTAQLPQGIIHADLFRDNVLFDGDRIGGLIDFYFSCTDTLLYDVAITVNDWCVDVEGRLDKDKAQAMLRAYHAVRPLQQIECDEWKMMLRKAALRFWLSRLYDLHLPRDGELVNAHDPKRYRDILQHHIQANETIWL